MSRTRSKGSTLKRIVALCIAVVGLCALLAWGAPSVLGFSLWQLGDALAVGAAMAAKLGCSSHFITRLDEQRIIDDLAGFSPVNRLLTMHYGERQVRASLLGLAEASATWRPGIGCTLDIGDTRPLDALVPAQLPEHDAPWPVGERVETIDPGVQAAVSRLLEQDNAAGLETRAVVVVRDGRIVAEGYADGIGPQTPLLGFSMGKSVTAVMIGRMQQLGLLPRDERAFDQRPLFAAWAGDARRDIRFVHLLQMTSGLKFDETYAPGSDSTRILFLAHSASDEAMRSPLEHPPGEHFQYSSGTTNLLSRFVHDRLGGSQAQIDFFAREILAPLGMRHTVFEPDPSGVFVGSSYIYGSGRDWARLGLLLLDRGQFGGAQLLDPQWVDRAHALNEGTDDPRYGYQLWLNGAGDPQRWPELPGDAYGMAGNRGQHVMIVPSARAVLVRLGWTNGPYPKENLARLLAALP